jgi:hypothetical protein
MAMRRVRCTSVFVPFLVACLAGGAVAARSTSAPSSPPRQADCLHPDTLAVHARAMALRVEAAMGAGFVRPVTAVCLTADSARTRLRGLAVESLDEARSSGLLAVFERLGLSHHMSPDSMVVPAAWYEDGCDSVWIQADTALAGGRLDELLVHELVHAFHDQTYDLRRFKGGGSDTTSWDLVQARKCVIEGQAQWIELQLWLASRDRSWAAGELSTIYWELENVSLRQVTENQARRARSRLPRDVRIPPSLREVSLFGWLPFYWYIMGTVFADQMVAAGGEAQLAQVMRAPPVSLKQILHPQSFLRKPRPPRLFRPGPVDSLWPGSTELNRDTYGQLLLRLYLEMHGQGKQAGFLTKGWDGDLLLLLNQDGGPPVLLWWTVWNAVWDAAGFAEGYRATLPSRGVKKSLGPDLWRGPDPDRRWSVWREDCRVLIIEDAPAADFATLHAAMSRVMPQAAPPDSGTGTPDSASRR